MHNTEIDNLVAEIKNVHSQEFWYGSKLLERAKNYKDERVTRALAIRHHFLQNKKAGSCYVLRHTIKALEEPYFNTLWDMIFSNDRDESEAASFILGEIGGLWTFQKILNILRSKGEDTYPILIPCLTHLINRYYDIQEEKEPTMQVMDVKTEQTETVFTRDIAPDIYERTLQDRQLSNELFNSITDDRISEMISLLRKIPQDCFGQVDKEKLITAIDNLKMD